MNNKLRVVGITGANGFIGRNIASKLHNKGFKVISLQRITSASNHYETRLLIVQIRNINEEARARNRYHYPCRCSCSQTTS